MRPARRSLGGSGGFSLVEVMVAAAVSGLILLACAGVVRLASTPPREDTDLSAAAELIARDVRGLVISEPRSFLESSIEFATTADSLASDRRAVKVRYSVERRAEKAVLVREESSATDAGSASEGADFSWIVLEADSVSFSYPPLVVRIFRTGRDVERVVCIPGL